jgi:hypothetical protein
MQKEFETGYEIVYINCLEAAHRLNFSITKENITDGIIIYKTKMSILSWGETFKIKISKINDTRTKVDVESALNAQLIDWGKNESNIVNFIKTLTEILKK